MDKQNIQELFDVTGKVALITGATGGFGKAAAKGLAAAGAKVMVTGRATAKLEQLVKDIRDGGGQAAFSAGDPAKHDDVQRVVKDTVSTFGGIDILITAAGMNKVGMIVDQPVEEFENIMNANVKGTWLFCKEVGPGDDRTGQRRQSDSSLVDPRFARHGSLRGLQPVQGRGEPSHQIAGLRMGSTQDQRECDCTDGIQDGTYPVDV